VSRLDRLYSAAVDHRPCRRGHRVRRPRTAPLRTWALVSTPLSSPQRPPSHIR
jgi:hypothetical protein